MKTTEQLRELIALADKATPGPWKSGDNWISHGESDFSLLLSTEGAADQEHTGYDLAYITACSPEIVREIVNELMTMQDRVAQLSGLLRATIEQKKSLEEIEATMKELGL